jgi:hypothetical protein
MNELRISRTMNILANSQYMASELRQPKPNKKLCLCLNRCMAFLRSLLPVVTLHDSFRLDTLSPGL